MIEAFYLALYLLILSPLLYYMGVDNPFWIFAILMILTLPGLYAMIKGAPYLPTDKKRVKKMIKLADIKKGTKVSDLGSGDGRIVFAAAKNGAVAIGYELSIPLYIWTKVKSYFNPNVSIYCKDFWHLDHSDQDVIFCFLLVETMKRFEAEIWPTLKPGAKVISNSFRLPNQQPVYDENRVKMYIKS
jgi:SAM-dependent methyltransferase